MKSERVPVPRYRRGSGTALFSAGFRPFFLLAGIWSAGALGLYIALLLGYVALPLTVDAVTWHAHEMLFGFVAATVTGFLLTAVPNWTGRLPLEGGGLMVLVALWAAGRAALLLPDAVTPAGAAVIDMAFLVAVLAVAAREILAGKNWRNLPILAALTLLVAGNGLMHGEALDLIAADGAGRRLSVATIVCLIVLVGGRIVPSFTRNWLKKQNNQHPPASFGALDRFAVASTIGALALWTVWPDTAVTAALLVLAGLANLVRLARWQGWRTGAEALVWVLHLGYAWIPAGLLLLGLSRWWTVLPPSGALHALTAGAMGTMTLAVMSRATLGHTGRVLHAGGGLTAVYVLVSAASVARVVVAAWEGASSVLLWIAALCWIAAFAGFVVVCGPMLMLRKPAGRAP